MDWQLKITAVAEPTGLRLTGEIDLATTADLEIALEPLLGAGDNVVLDLGGLTFIDVIGMRLLARTALHLRSVGLQLRLLRASDQVQLLSGLLGWADLLGLSQCMIEHAKV
jgi:anti-anti-sigma factor